MQSIWKFVHASVKGTSHERSDQPCQDYAAVRTVAGSELPVLVAVCADGAGSSQYSEEGSSIACRTALSSLSDLLESGLSIDSFGPDSLIRAFQAARRQLSLAACFRGVPINEFACTFLAAVIGEGKAFFGQIGDGAIVIRSHGELRPVFWPQSGEYANTTNFLSGAEFEGCLQTAELREQIAEVAIFTDGLQSLALRFAERTAHEPFFRPMLETLRQCPSPDALDAPLRSFLGSKAVNDRTDDDKTLILATLCED